MDKNTNIHPEIEVDTSKIKDRDIKINIDFKVILCMLACGAAFFATTFFAGTHPTVWIPSILMGVLFGYISMVDIKLHLCPDWASLVVLSLSLPQLIFYIATSNWTMIISMALGLVVGLVPLLLGALFSKGGMGGADIKIMGAAGLFLGIDKTFFALIVGLAIAIIVNLVLRVMKRVEKESRFALLPYLCCGCIIAPLFFIF